MLKKHLLFPLVILAISATTAIISYQQAPGAMLTPDSQTYLNVVAIMAAHHLSLSSLINPVRLPGYPLFLFLLGPNLQIATIVQLILFVVVALLTYWIALLIFDLPWIALCCSLLVASNPTLIAYFKQIMSECLACLFLSLLSLLCILYLRSSRWPWLLGVGMLLLLLIFTRPEWIALPLLLFPLLLFGAKQQNRSMLLRHLLVVVVLAACIYGCIGLYIQRNGEQNGYHGFSAVQNMNQLGKVLQYGMEDEATPPERIHTAKLKMCVARLGTRDPWPLLSCARDLASPWAQPAGAYAWSIIISHPIEFFLKSVPLFFIYLISYFDPSPLHRSLFLQVLTGLHHLLYLCNILFPLLIFWPIWLLRQKRAASITIWSMSLLWCVMCYGSILVALASYANQDSMRFHSVFSPFMTMLIWGSILFLATRLRRKVYEKKSNNHPLPTL